MRPRQLASELERIADEARAARERLRELLRLAAELRAQLDAPEAKGPGEHDDAQGEAFSARKLHSVQ